MCDRDDDGNVIDPIFSEVIPDEYVVTFTQNGVQFCLDIRVLAEDSYQSGRYENPLNRQTLPEDVVSQVREYMQAQEVRVTGSIRSVPFEFTISRFENLGRLLTLLYRDARFPERLGYDGIYIRVGNSVMDVYDVDLSIPIRDVLTLSGMEVFPVVFSRLTPEERQENYQKLLTYIERNDIGWLKSQIELARQVDAKVQSNPSDLELIQLMIDNKDKLSAETLRTGLYRLTTDAKLRVSDIERFLEQLSFPADFMFVAAIDPYNIREDHPGYRPLFSIATELSIEPTVENYVLEEDVPNPRVRPVRRLDLNRDITTYTLADLETIAQSRGPEVYDEFTAILTRLREEEPARRGFTGNNAYLTMMQNPQEAETFRTVARARLYEFLRGNIDVADNDEEIDSSIDVDDSRMQPVTFFYAPEFYTADDLRDIIVDNNLDEYEIRETLSDADSRRFNDTLRRDLLYAYLLSQLNVLDYLNVPARTPNVNLPVSTETHTYEIEEAILTINEDNWENYLDDIRTELNAMLDNEGYTGVNRYIEAFADDEFIGRYNMRRRDIALSYVNNQVETYNPPYTDPELDDILLTGSY